MSKRGTLDEKVECFETACKTAFAKARFKVKRRQSTYRSAMRPRHTISITAAFTGCLAACLQRRSIWTKETADLIAGNIHEHHERAGANAAAADEEWTNDFIVKYHPIEHDGILIQSRR